MFSHFQAAGLASVTDLSSLFLASHITFSRGHGPLRASFDQRERNLQEFKKKKKKKNISASMGKFFGNILGTISFKSIGSFHTKYLPW